MNPSTPPGYFKALSPSLLISAFDELGIKINSADF